MVLSYSVQHFGRKLLKENNVTKFHRLYLLEKWSKALCKKIDSWTPAKYFNVYSQHFRENNYRKLSSGVPLTDLLNSTVPSLNKDNLKYEKCSYNNRRMFSLLECVNTEHLQNKINKTLSNTIIK